MAFNLSGLSTYVDEQREPLIRKAVAGAKSASLFNLQTGVKSQAALNLLNTSIVFGDGGTCGWDEAGQSTLTQRTLTVGQFKVNMSFCDKALEKYWAGYNVKVGAGAKALPFEEAFTADIVEKVQAEVEKVIYQGDKASADANLKRADGLLKIIKNDVPSANKLTKSASVKAMIDDVYAAIPTAILDKASILVGRDAFRTYVLALAALNLYHYNPQVDGEMTVVIPGTSTKVIGVAGLDGTGRAIAADIENNIFFGCDMEGDAEEFKIWYSEDNREFRLAIEFNAGVQIAFPDQVILGKYTDDPVVSSPVSPVSTPAS